MEYTNFAFGRGPCVRVWKNIVLLEINKFIPKLFKRFDINLVDLARNKLLPSSLVLQNGLDITLKHRDGDTLL